MLVEIENFQAITKTRFEIDGFTALVGRSNIGKSAVVRALKCALTGAEGTDFVRHDPETCARILKGNKKCKCFSSVKIHFDESNLLLWEKGDAKNQYTTWENGVSQEYSRVGKNPDMPPILKGFEPIQLGSNPKELVQVSDQFTPIFLLNVTGTVVADLLSDVAKLDDINKAMKAVTRDRKKASSTRDVREKDIADIEKGLKAYATLDNTSRQVERVEGLYGDVQASKGNVVQVNGFIRRLIAGRDAMKVLKEALAHELPEQAGLEDRLDSYLEASKWDVAYDGLQSDVGALTSATSKDLPGQDLDSKLRKFQEVSGFLKRIQGKEPVVKALRGVDALEIPPLKFEDALGKLDDLTSLLRRCQDVKRALTQYKGVGEVTVPLHPDLEPRVSALQEMQKFQSRLLSLKKSIKGLEAEYTEAASEEKSVLKEFEDLGVCPTCSQNVGPGHGANHV